MWLLLIILTFLLAFSQALKSWVKRKKAEIELFREKWKVAREERITWQERHWWLGFDCPEYQRLWEIEIGAEILYLISMQVTILGVVLTRGASISWSDWRFEQKQANQETDE